MISSGFQFDFELYSKNQSKKIRCFWKILGFVLDLFWICLDFVLIFLDFLIFFCFFDCF